MYTNAEWKNITGGIILLSLTAEVKKQNNKNLYLEKNQKKILLFLSHSRL